MWTPPSGTLGELADEARVRAAALKTQSKELERAARTVVPPPSFAAALKRNDVAVIAEVKRFSPSKGAINPGLDLGSQVSAYASGGAAAISILTESMRFGGSDEDLVQARSYVSLPLLKKDFHVDVVQIFQAKALGASAALVIARAVGPETLRDLLSAGRDCGLEIVVEVRDEPELARALALNATVVGINNRNLETLEVDAGTAIRLLPQIPAGIVAIAESGVSRLQDVEEVAAVGADAVLVGSYVSGSENPEEAVRSLTGSPRTGGARKS